MGSADVWHFARVNWFSQSERASATSECELCEDQLTSSAKMAYKSTSRYEICLYYRN